MSLVKIVIVRSTDNSPAKWRVMENATVHVVYTHFYAIKCTEANHFQKIIVP